MRENVKERKVEGEIRGYNERYVEKNQRHTTCATFRTQVPIGLSRVLCEHKENWFSGSRYLSEFSI